MRDVLAMMPRMSGVSAATMSRGYHEETAPVEFKLDAVGLTSIVARRHTDGMLNVWPKCKSVLQPTTRSHIVRALIT